MRDAAKDSISVFVEESPKQRAGDKREGKNMSQNIFGKIVF